MKVIDVIVKRVLSDFVKNEDQLIDEAKLYSDLNLSPDDLRIVRKRIETVFSLRIPEDVFMNKSTFGEIKEFVKLLYSQVLEQSNVSLN